MTALEPDADGTRRARTNPSEQKDRLPEQLRPAPSQRARRTLAFDQRRKRPPRPRALVRLRSRPKERPKALPEVLGHRVRHKAPEPDQNPAPLRRAPNEDRAMPVEPHQIQDPLHKPRDPRPNAGPRDFVAPGHLGNGLPLMDLRRRPKDLPHIVRLAREHIKGQNSLPRPAAPTAGQPNTQEPIPRVRLQTPLHPAAGQRETGTPASSAARAAKHRVVRAQDLVIPGRLHRKYVDHRVPPTAPGLSVKKVSRGRRVFRPPRT
jgi:hypothetical protein